MRIAINGRFLSQRITGVQRVCREFALAFDRLLSSGELPGVTARIIVPAATVADIPAYRAIEVVRSGWLSGYAWEQLELSKAAGRDVLLSLANLTPVTRLFQRGRPSIVLVHDLSYVYFPSAYSLPFRAAYSVITPLIMRHADCVATVSNTERNSILDVFGGVPGLPDRLIALANGGFSAEVLAQYERAPPPREDFALYVGSFSTRKNIDGVIATAIRLARERGMRFVLAGGTAAAFTDVSIQIPSDVVDKLTFLGQVDDLDTLVDLYRRAAVLVFPSRFESSGLPPTEAMAFGCPVVVSRIPSLIERCGDAAEYCDPENVDSIVAAVSAVVGDPARAAMLSRAGRDRAAIYSWAAQVRGVIAAAERVSSASLPMPLAPSTITG